MPFGKPKSDWRKSWKDAKAKNKEWDAVQLKSNLGPELDKLYAKANTPLKSPSTIEAEKLDKETKVQAVKVDRILDEYIQLCNGVPEPAKTNLTKVLGQIKTEIAGYKNL
jgi:hypothetical protein